MTGAMYQIGALAALEDGVRGLDGQGFSLYVGHSTGATVAAALAGGSPVERLYRALLDPVDNFFPLERGHVYRMDLDEWQRTLATGWVALRQLFSRLRRRGDAATQPVPAHLFLWDQIDRLSDSLPAGLFSLDRYERFLSEFFLRRGIPNSFRAMPRALRIATHDIDSGVQVMFGAEGYDGTPVSLACAASLAMPLFFSPVRIGGRHYVDGGLGHVAHLDVAAAEGVKLAIVVSPLVPVAASYGSVPTGHGIKGSVRDKGLVWMFNQGLRISSHARLHQEVALTRQEGAMQVLVVEPEPTDAMLFLHNPADLAARRTILEAAYRTTRDRIAEWIARHEAVAEQMGWSLS
jgi:predicted acylesterase/phospholipase RssA